MVSAMHGMCFRIQIQYIFFSHGAPILIATQHKSCQYDPHLAEGHPHIIVLCKQKLEPLCYAKLAVATKASKRLHLRKHIRTRSLSLHASHTVAQTMSSEFLPPPPQPKTGLGRYRVLSSRAGVRVSPIQLGKYNILVASSYPSGLFT